MTLTIRDDARREIQKDVDALTKSPKYFGIKVERARTYFPLIEKVFAEERLPDDFKYLAIQESSLIADAVSVSDAVGFWQFKDFTAMEMGLRVDKQIDERMNIVSASRGAARYLKQNNFMFNNWLYALWAYQMGAGGVKRVVGDEFNGARHMEITSDTYWYIKKFIAHKVAFEDAVKGDPQVKVQVYELREKKELSDLATQLGVDETHLKENNKWIRSGTIPDDRTYALIVPGGKLDADFNTLLVSTSSAVTAQVTDKTVKKKINGIMAIQASGNESAAALAARAGLGVGDFLKFNDISIDHRVRNGEFYFTGKKKNRSSTLTHTLDKGEDLWLVSQRYGVSLKRVRRLNRLGADENLNAGEVVWLSTRKPAGKPVDEKAQLVVADTDSGQGEFFDWEVNPGSSKVIVASKPASADKEIKEKAITVNSMEVTNTSLANPGNHVVAPGETLYAIAKKYNVAVTDLLEWNKLDINKGLRPGQEISTISRVNTSAISVPEPNEKNQDVRSEQWITYEVKPSDTLYSVARQYNVTIKEIMDWNNKSDFALSLGEKIKILTR